MTPAICQPAVRAAATLLLAATLVGCQSPSLRTASAPQPQPPATTEPATPRAKALPPPESPPPASAARPAPAAGGENPNAHPPPAEIGAAPQPTPAAVPPDYLTVIEPLDRARPFHVDAEAQPAGVLRLSTANVRRLRLFRERLPFTTSGSVAVRIDGQGVEWSGRHAWIELERSAGGQWIVVERYPK